MVYGMIHAAEGWGFMYSCTYVDLERWYTRFSV